MWGLHTLLLLVSGTLYLEEVLCVTSLSTQTNAMHYLERRNAGLQSDNTGNEFYIGFMDNYVKPAFRSIESLLINRSTIFMTTADPSGAVTSIESEQGTSMSNLSFGITVAKTIAQFKVQFGSDRNKGIKIKAEQSKQISLFALNEELHSVDGFTALPCSHFASVNSYEYYAVSVPPSTIVENTADSAFLIVACSDDTTVTITPSQTIPHPYIPDVTVRAGTGFSTTLQERETLYVQSREDLTGSKVVSTAPISFFTGHECGNVPADVAECDHLVEQIPPTVTWGNQFLLAPTATRRANDIIKIIASQDATQGKVSCTDLDGGVTFTLSQAGAFRDIDLPANTYCFIETDKPTMTIQFTTGGGADGIDSGDPFMVIVPAVSQYLMNTTFSTVNGLGLFFTNYINIFVPAGSNIFNPSNILVDGTPIIADNWVSIPCFAENLTCGHATIANISDGAHSIWNADNDTPIGLIVYGLSYLETYAYVGGLKLSLPGLDPDQFPTSHFILSGTSVCIQCHNGNERLPIRAAVDWRKEDASLLRTPQHRITVDGSLCIDNATLNDAGNYTCYMYGEPHLHQLSVIGGIIVEPPTCSSTDKGALVGVGRGTAYIDNTINAVQVCCRVQGPQGTTVTWFIDGSLISKGTDGYEYKENYIRYSGPMTLGCVTFTCQANFSSSLPVVRESSKICIGINSAPSMVNITGRTSVLEHSSVTYQCSADGFPAPMRVWTADRDEESYLPETATDHGNGTLTINNITEMDGRRKYCCDVSNEHGQQYNCISLAVLIPPEIVKVETSALLIISVPFGATLPLHTPQNVSITIGQVIMIPETYTLNIECLILRANPMPIISWFHDNVTINTKYPPYMVQTDGTLVIEDVLRGRDDGLYTCIADTPDVGRDESSSTIIVTVPPQLNSSDLVNSPGNCLDLTQDMDTIQQVGIDLCVKAGPHAGVTLTCEVLQGVPIPEVTWLRNGKDLSVTLTAGSYKYITNTLTLMLPVNASSTAKKSIEGNYSCVAINPAGVASASSYITLFGDIPMQSAIAEFVHKQSDLYEQLHKTVSEHFPGVQEGTEHLMFLTSGKVLSYEDFDPGYLYDESEESVLPQTMENMFDLVDIIPDGQSIVFNPRKAQRLQKTYSELLEMLHVSPSSLTETEQQEIRAYLLETVQDLGSSTNTLMPRLSLYLLYKNTYYMTVLEIDEMIDMQKQILFEWEFMQWYKRNMNILNSRKQEALTRWKMFADKEGVEERLSSLKLTDYSQDINAVRVLLLTDHRESRFKDEKSYYLITLIPDTWYKELQNKVTESIPQMQFQLTQLKTELHILEITSQYLEKESEKRRVVNALFPSSDPINRLYCDLDMATFHLEELVKESEDMRYECLVSGNPTDCHLYWDLQEYIHDEVVTNYTEFYWYVHTVQAALNHRDYSIPAISSTISEIQLKAEKIQTPINIALSELAKRDRELSDRDFFSEFSFRPQSLSSEYNFELPSSIIGRLMWYINPETTQLVPREVVEEYNLTFNHLNTAITNMSAKLMNVNIHRRWFKAAIFSNEHLRLKNVDVMVSPGVMQQLRDFHNTIKNGSYHLPLYPTSLLLATDIELTVDIPFIFHTLPTLIKLSYDPHITGGFGPFSFGPLHRARAGNIKFRVDIRDNQITITIPGTQLIGYACSVVPQHPRTNFDRSHDRSIRSMSNANTAGSDFDEWLFSKQSNLPIHNKLFHKDAGDHEKSFSSPVGDDKLLIAPTHPSNKVHSDLGMSVHYSVSTNSSNRHVTNTNV